VVALKLRPALVGFGWRAAGSVNERRMAGAQPCFDIAPELPGKRQDLGNLRLRHGCRSVIRDAVALAPEGVEFPHQRRVGPDGVFHGFDRDRVMAGRVTDPQTVHQAKFSMGTVLAIIAVHGRAGLAGFDARLEFRVKLIARDGDDAWVEVALAAIRETLRAPKPPAVKEDCEYCRFAAGRSGPTAPALGATPGVEGRFSNFASSMARSGEVWRHDTMSNPATRPASGTLRILRRRGAGRADAAPCGAAAQVPDATHSSSATSSGEYSTRACSSFPMRGS